MKTWGKCIRKAAKSLWGLGSSARSADMEVTVVTASNAPPKPIIAVHAGNVRRQMKLEAERFCLFQSVSIRFEIFLRCF